MAKTKSVDGKAYGPSAFAYVGDPQDTSTWHLPIFDAAHCRDAMARFGEAEMPDAAKKAKAFRKIMARAKKLGIDGSGFAEAHKSMQASSFTEMGGESDDSFEDLRDEIGEALKERFGTTQQGWAKYYIVATYPDYVIVRSEDDGEMYRVGYTEDEQNDSFTFEEPQPVEIAYVPVQEAAAFLADAAAADADEWTYPVRAMKAGVANGFVSLPNGKQMPQYYPPEVIAQVAQALNNGRFGRVHPKVGDNTTEAVDASRVAGYTTDGRVVGDAAHCNVHLFKSETELQAKLASARAEKQLDKFGVSTLAYYAFKVGKVDGQDVLVAIKLAKFSSLDLCVEPAAGGAFLDNMRAAASKDVLAEISAMQAQAVRKNSGGSTAESQGGGDAGPFGGAMKDRIMKALLALRALDAGRADTLQKEFEALTDEAKHAEFLVRVAEASVEAGKDVAKKAVETVNQQQTTVAAVKAANDAIDQAKAMLAEAKQLTSDNLVEKKLKESKLPEPAQAIVRAHCAKRVVDEAAIDAEITLVRTQLAAMSPVGRVGDGYVVGGMESIEKACLALDALMGVKEAEAKLAEKRIPKMKGIKEAYRLITGDDGLNFNGRGGFLTRSSLAKSWESIPAEFVARTLLSTAVTSDFPNLLLNSMTKRLLQDYAENAIPGLDSLVSFVDVNDFKTQDRVRVGYLADWATVAEDAPYVDFTLPTDELATWNPTKRGNTFPISRETIINDDLGKITVFPSRMGRAARRTLARFITSFFANNSTYSIDTLAWFHATHNNLMTSPLNIDNLVAAEILLMNQTEKDSGERIGLSLDWLMVPNELKAAAFKINNAEFYPVGPNFGPGQPNPFYKRFGQNGERIIVNYLLTDTNDWYVGTSAATAPFLEVGFVLGVREPQMFLQNDPNVGAVFTNDRITYKGRHEYGGGETDYRPVVKSAAA